MERSIPILRTLLFVPSNQQRKLERAALAGADALILDLEDSVPPSEKEAAREMVAKALRKLASCGKEIFVRINPLSTRHAWADIVKVVTSGLGGIVLPKVDSANDIHLAESMLADAEKRAGLEAGMVSILALVETPKGIIHAYEIAKASQRIAGIVFGAEDYALEMGIERSREGTEIYYPRMVIPVACHAANVLAIDCVYPDVKDKEGLIRETKLAKQMGFHGKAVIHPDQVAPVNEVFSPSPEDIEQARRVVEAFETALTEGKASTSLDGKMIDLPVFERARRLLSMVPNHRQKEKGVGRQG